MRKFVGVAVLVALPAAATVGCAGGGPQTIQTQQINKATFQGTWPAVPDSGLLACDSFRGRAVTFTPAGSETTYALNPSAIAWAPKQFWEDFTTISTTDNWGDLIGEGAKLCAGQGTQSASSQ